MSADAQEVARRLRWRCRRGLLELDLLLTHFLERGYGRLDRPQRHAFERLLATDDNTLLAYLNGTRCPDERELSELVQQIRAPNLP